MIWHFVVTLKLKTVIRKSDKQLKRSGAGSYPTLTLSKLLFGAHLNWLAKIKLKGPGPPESLILLGAQLHWRPFQYYCKGSI